MPNNEIPYGEFIGTMPEDGRYTPRPPALPSDFDTTLFDTEQLEYLSDYYAAALRTHTEYFFALLRLHPCEPEPTARTVMINAAIICKLSGINEGELRTPWRDYPKRLAIRTETFLAHKNAVLAAMRTARRKVFSSQPRPRHA